MIKVTSVTSHTDTFLSEFYNLETESTVDWITIGTDVYNVVASHVPDKTKDFPNAPTTFGLHGDTPILLLNGERYTIGRWYAERKTSRLASLIYDKNNKRFIGGDIGGVTVSSNTTYYTITLDNGQSFKCTGDLPVVLENNTWKIAKDLKQDDPLKTFFNYDNITKKFTIAPVL